MPSTTRQFAPFVLMAILMMVLTVLLFSRFLTKRQEGVTQVSGQLEAEIVDRVQSWEDRVVEQLDGFLLDVSSAPEDGQATEQRLRQHERWLDAVYLWRPWREIVVGGRRTPSPGVRQYPYDPPVEDKDRIYARPCMLRARLLTMDPRVTTRALADAYVEGCAKEPVPVRMVATTEAAHHLQRTGQFGEALQALDSSGVDLDRSIQEILRQGLDPWRFVVQRTQRAEVLLALGREDEALDLLSRTGAEITALPAPVMERGRLLPYVGWPIIARLRSAGRDADVRSLTLSLARAERRILGWREIEERILPRPPAPTEETGRFIYDQYHDTPFLLYYDGGLDSGVGVGVQLDQPLLIQDFMSSMRRYRRDLVLTDASGQRVAGVRQDGDIAFSVPFTQTLTHLRVGIRQQAVDQRMDRFDDQLVLLVVLGVACVALLLLLLLTLYRAQNGLNQLLERQREFTTRVTHELKTPLAGIRVMAENLAAGAYRDDGHMREMADRIVDEADRLTQRVDEVLSVTRERKIPDPEPFDPEESVLEAIDTWGPRLEHAGVTLHADLHPTDEVLGDMAAVRDAVGCLLDNALKYRKQDAEAPAVWLTLSQRGASVEIEVVDNGLGVPPAKRKEIFERFARVEGPNRGLAGGHGLGLAQVSEVARLHQGDVRCTEGIDGGARFTLSLRSA